jgi:tellurite resistance protein
LTLAVVSSWIGHRPFETPHLNPAWFIPAVGNVIVPVAGVPLGYVEVSWFFFSVGMVFWVILMTLIFNRLIFHNPLPERLLPTKVILIAPPAVGFIAYTRLTEGLDPFARILFYAAVLFALLMVVGLPKFARIGFALSWWAYSFPIAAFTIATFLYAEKAASVPHLYAAYGLTGVLVTVIALLVAATARAIARGDVCKPE